MEALINALKIQGHNSDYLEFVGLLRLSTGFVSITPKQCADLAFITICTTALVIYDKKLNPEIYDIKSLKELGIYQWAPPPHAGEMFKNGTFVNYNKCMYVIKGKYYDLNLKEVIEPLPIDIDQDYRIFNPKSVITGPTYTLIRIKNIDYLVKISVHTNYRESFPYTVLINGELPPKSSINGELPPVPPRPEPTPKPAIKPSESESESESEPEPESEPKTESKRSHRPPERSASKLPLSKYRNYIIAANSGDEYYLINEMEKHKMTPAIECIIKADIDGLYDSYKIQNEVSNLKVVYKVDCDYFGLCEDRRVKKLVDLEMRKPSGGSFTKAAARYLDLND